MTILSGIPNIFSCIDLVADYYFNNSIKDVERIKHGTSKKKIVRSMKSKLPSEISQFLSCGKNKNRLKVLEMLKCDELVISREGECRLLTQIEEKIYDHLLSAQEEADTKIIGHVVEMLHQDTENKVIRSASGDTYILVLSTALLNNFKEHVVIDQGCSQ